MLKKINNISFFFIVRNYEKEINFIISHGKKTLPKLKFVIFYNQKLSEKLIILNL